MWKVQSETNTAHILGSIHFMKKEMYPLSQKIEEAFESSEVLAVEANINDVNQLDIRKLMGTAFYADDSLENHISRETYALVQKEFQNAGIPSLLMNKQKPWFLALTLTSLKLMQLGFDPNYGVDAYFLSKASGTKKIKELESVDYQIRLLSGFSDKDQETFLLYTLGDLNSLEKDARTLETAWKSGDTDTIEALIMKSGGGDKDMSVIYEKILYERNGNMAAKIEDFLKTREKYFVVVGAGHLVGKKGIIDILRQKGYRIEQL